MTKKWAREARPGIVLGHGAMCGAPPPPLRGGGLLHTKVEQPPITFGPLGEQVSGAGVARAWRGRGAGYRHFFWLGWRERGAGVARALPVPPGRFTDRQTAVKCSKSSRRPVFLPVNSTGNCQ
eukprot:gene12338-biopygen407